jgi:hypothetical protein
LTGIFPVLGKSVIGGDVRGVDRNRAAEALRDRKVERTKPGAGAIDPSLSLSAGRGARAMILRRINLLKVKGIMVMFCSLTHGNARSATMHANISFLMDCEVRIGLEGIRIDFGTRCPQGAQPGAGRRQGGSARAKAIPTLDEFQFGKQAA